MPEGGTVRLGASCSDGARDVRGRGHRERHQGRDHAAGLRALLHDEGQRHRAGTGHRAAARAGPRGRDLARERGLRWRAGDRCPAGRRSGWRSEQRPARRRARRGRRGARPHLRRRDPALSRLLGRSRPRTVRTRSTCWSLGACRVLLLDIRMPRRTGIEVLQALDSPPNVILMSAYRFEGEDKRSVGHKVFSHLMKPVAPRQLLDEVRAAMGSTRPHDRSLRRAPDHTRDRPASSTTTSRCRDTLVEVLRMDGIETITAGRSTRRGNSSPSTSRP